MTDISFDTLKEEIYRILYNDVERTPDQRFGQWLSNKICQKYNCGRDDVERILFNLENTEILDMVKYYFD